MDRKDMLLEQAFVEGEKSPEAEQRLKKATDIGSMYLALTSTPGWKDLMTRFIDVRLSQDRYLDGKTEDLPDIRAAQRELIELLRFVKNEIATGTKSFKMLNNSK